MAILDEKRAYEELRKKKFRSVYYCHGEDSYKQSLFAQRLQSALLGEDANAFTLSVHYGDELDAGQLLEESNSLSLWQVQKRLIIVRGAERIPAKQHDSLKKLLEKKESDSIVVFLAQKADARTKWIQAIQKAPDCAALIHFDFPAEWELAQAARQFAKDEGKEIEETAVQLLVEWNQASLGQLKQSIAQAALYAVNSPAIEVDSVRAVTLKLRPESAFELTEAVLKQNRGLALERLHSLLDQGEEPLALLGLLVRQYRWLLAILAGKAEAKNDNEIQSELRLFPKVAGILFQAAKRRGIAGIRSGLLALSKADYSLKSSREPADLVMTRLIVLLTE